MKSLTRSWQSVARRRFSCTWEVGASPVGERPKTLEKVERDDNIYTAESLTIIFIVSAATFNFARPGRRTSVVRREKRSRFNERRSFWDFFFETSGDRISRNSCYLIQLYVTHREITFDPINKWSWARLTDPSPNETVPKNHRCHFPVGQFRCQVIQNHTREPKPILRFLHFKPL